MICLREWQTPRMQSLFFHHQAFLVWQETAMKNLGKDFFCIKHYLGDGSFPFHQDAGNSHHHGKMPFTGSLLNPLFLPLFDFLDTPLLLRPQFSGWNLPRSTEIFRTQIGVTPGFLPCWIGSLRYPDIVTQNWLPISSLPSPKKHTQGAPKTCDTALLTWESMVSRFFKPVGSVLSSRHFQAWVVLPRKFNSNYPIAPGSCLGRCWYSCLGKWRSLELKFGLSWIWIWLPGKSRNQSHVGL